MGLPRYKLGERHRERMREEEREGKRERRDGGGGGGGGGGRKTERERERERERETWIHYYKNRQKGHIIINKSLSYCPAKVVKSKMMCLHPLWVTVCHYMLSIF